MERIIIGFIFGAVFGSFIDCIANRSYTKQSFWGRSHCDNCKKTLTWYQLFPIISYLTLRGKCTSCHKKISLESTLVEIITGLITAMVAFMLIPANFITYDWTYQLLIGLDFLFKLFAIYVFIMVFITDIKTGLIPDRITYPSVIIAAGYLILTSILKIALFYFSLKNSPLGQYLLPPASNYFYNQILTMLTPVGLSFLSGIVVGLFFLILILATSGRGMGGGDMKLGVFIGLVLGFPVSVAAIMLAFLLGSIFGIALLLIRLKKFGQTIPFGPFLSIASVIALLWGEKLIDWYLNFHLF